MNEHPTIIPGAPEPANDGASDEPCFTGTAVGYYHLVCYAPDVEIKVRADGDIEVNGEAVSDPGIVGEAFMVWARYMAENHLPEPHPLRAIGSPETEVLGTFEGRVTP